MAERKTINQKDVTITNESASSVPNELQLPDKHRDDWDFLKGFFQREEQVLAHNKVLQGNVAQLSAAMQHAGHAAQQDRIALNKSHNHMKELEEAFTQSESERARLANKLHDNEQELRMCQANFDHEFQRHQETEKNLERIWDSHNHLGQLMSKVNCVVDQGIQSMTYNITDLVLDLAAKTQKIYYLENQIDHEQQQHDADIFHWRNKLDNESNLHTEEFMAQKGRLEELEQLLRGLQKSSDDKAPEKGQRPKRRRSSNRQEKPARDVMSEEAATCETGIVRSKSRDTKLLSTVMEVKEEGEE